MEDKLRVPLKPLHAIEFSVMCGGGSVGVLNWAHMIVSASLGQLCVGSVLFFQCGLHLYFLQTKDIFLLERYDKLKLFINVHIKMMFTLGYALYI